MPTSYEIKADDTYSFNEMHEIVKLAKKSNFLKARMPVTSQMNVEVLRTFESLLGSAAAAAAQMWLPS